MRNMNGSDITVSMAGCAGQRCMAASALVLVGEDAKCQEVLDKVCQKVRHINAVCACVCVS